jgi:hypothetical protein
VYDGRNRSFFFFDYAGLREVRGNTFVNTVPTAKARTGDFSEYLGANLCTNAAGAQHGRAAEHFSTPLLVTNTNNETVQARLGMMFDPLTTRANPGFNSSQPVSAANPQTLRSAFTNNIIPQARINLVGLNVASIYPLPQNGSLQNNFTSVVNREAVS